MLPEYYSQRTDSTLWEFKVAVVSRFWFSALFHLYQIPDYSAAHPGDSLFNYFYQMGFRTQRRYLRERDCQTFAWWKWGLLYNMVDSICEDIDLSEFRLNTFTPYFLLHSSVIASLHSRYSQKDAKILWRKDYIPFPLFAYDH